MTNFMTWQQISVNGTIPKIKNHTATLVEKELFVFGGYDGRRNHSTIHILNTETYTWRTHNNVGGSTPQGRNGHTATLAEGQLIIIGGWLGTGPLAASDMHSLDIETMTWKSPPVWGTPPGPCNMHTADYIPQQRRILVFRGGDGHEYLNDLHSLDIDTYRWQQLSPSGEIPTPRANHSSAVVGEQLFVFGGWDGHRRLNDVNVLNTETLCWSLAEVRGRAPFPRAGMTLSRLRGRLLLFGGSGPSAKCFNDLQIMDPGT